PELFRVDPSKRSSVRGEFGGASGTLLFGHVGRFCPQKNQQFIIDIFKEILRQHSNSKLIMAGVGEDMELIRARVMTAGISDKVIFSGQRGDVDRLYSAIDCF
ncbi:MAG: glycosyltransferase, partial [Ruminiclostridium sp.]|nr:glycosyltransferase [Ruminiclostridium sp.]